ncbi:MAG: hypothetical protein ACJAZ2_001167, partial [Glaciecola sp.]
ANDWPNVPDCPITLRHNNTAKQPNSVIFFIFILGYVDLMKNIYPIETYCANIALNFGL